MTKEKLNGAGFIRRAKHESHFFVQNNDTVQNTHLSFAAKGLLSYFLSNSDNWTIRKTWLYTHFPDGRRKVTHAFEELKSHGYIVEKTVRDSKGKFKGYDYEVHEVPLFTKTPIVQNEQSGCIKPNPIAQNPQSDNPQSGNPQSDNEQLINTKNNNDQLKIKTKENKETLSQFFENVWNRLNEEQKYWLTNLQNEIADYFNTPHKGDYYEAIKEYLLFHVPNKDEWSVSNIGKIFSGYKKTIDPTYKGSVLKYLGSKEKEYQDGKWISQKWDSPKNNAANPIRMQTKLARYIPEKRPDDYLQKIFGGNS